MPKNKMEHHLGTQLPERKRDRRRRGGRGDKQLNRPASLQMEGAQRHSEQPVACQILLPVPFEKHSDRPDVDEVEGGHLLSILSGHKGPLLYSAARRYAKDENNKCEGSPPLIRKRSQLLKL